MEKDILKERYRKEDKEFKKAGIKKCMIKGCNNWEGVGISGTEIKLCCEHNYQLSKFNRPPEYKILENLIKENKRLKLKKEGRNSSRA